MHALLVLAAVVQLGTCTKKPSIIQVSAGRSGSTLLSAILNTLPNSFCFGEPYHHFEKGMIAGDTPTIDELMNCSIFNRPAHVVKAVFWVYNCYFLPYIRSHNLFAACHNNTLDFQVLRAPCVLAERRMAKVIRVPFLHRKFQGSHVFPADSKVVNIVRAPWDVLRSQVCHHDKLTQCTQTYVM